MMKNIFMSIVVASMTFLGSIPAVAVPLVGKIGTTQSNKYFGGNLWYSSYIDFNHLYSFRAGEEIRIKVSGNAKWVYVRLLPKGASPATPTGMLGERIRVPSNGVITVKLKKAYPNIRQISLHSGHEAFNSLLSGFNGNANIVSIDVFMGK